MIGSTDIISSALKLTNEPAAIAERGRIVFLNESAVRITGADRTGCAVGDVFPQHVVNCQSPSFVTGAAIGGVSCALRADSLLGSMVYIFTPEEPMTAPGLFAAVPALRRELQNMKLASDRIVASAADTGGNFGAYCAALSHSYYQMKRLIQNISVIEGLSNGDLPFTPQAVDISALCADIVSTAASFARQRGVEVKFDGCGDALSSADGELMELMMLNLLTNSLMHTDKGGFVRLGVSSYDGGIMLSVDDSGCGIAPEVLRDIFSRYRRTLSLSDMSEGAGLGLAIARGIAEKHGGALIIESRPGYGASVRVSLPRSVSGSGHLRAPEAGYLSAGMDLILTQLSPWLPPESCGYKYDD